MLEDLRRRGELSGHSLAQVRAGRDRFGPVAAILFSSNGFISVRQRTDGTCVVTVWASDNLVAWGHTPSLDDVVTTMQGWQDGLAVPDLCDAAPYLQAPTPAAAVEAQWSLLTEHGETYLRPIIATVALHPTLRALRPWISHGTLHLLHPDHVPDHDHRGIVLHPCGNSNYQVHVYGGRTGPAEDPASAATRAATAAAAW
ncbi:DUF6193 family natural product biosynthesis protein [Dactylosporangium sp. CA-139066]|uniref:DUF6193 family natural product biosynthesis protein n=1 Tax=Dactylosporangium sp. CA-139066 TaxID=3239930 RepID=UPI003D93FE3E